MTRTICEGCRGAGCTTCDARGTTPAPALHLIVKGEATQAVEEAARRGLSVAVRGERNGFTSLVAPRTDGHAVAAALWFRDLGDAPVAELVFYS